jgi:lipopolysaccharide transport system ATP-binding protein
MNLPTVSKTETPAQSSPPSPDEVIRLENVSVRYRLPQGNIGTFKEYAIRWLQGKIRRNTFLALNNVSLSVRQGEVFGLIGKNGAGKSTLLKLLARVLRPTTGRVWVKGRVAPLLELGAGFHPELTGRENIYLNGALLGFTRQQMDAKFNRILEFSELIDFIDAPLRTYSTGMVARLGFSIATDERPDILIVDEILSVGDTEFQNKSFERIQNFQGAGTTILLVTHSIERVEEMCARAALLSHGQIVTSGSAKMVVDRYRGRVRQLEAERPLQSAELATVQRWGNRKVEITNVRITDGSGAPKVIFCTGDQVMVQMDYVAHELIPSPVFGVAIHRNDGAHITGPNTNFSDFEIGAIHGTGTVTYEIPSLPLLNGLYYFSVAIVNSNDTEMYDCHERVYPFRVLNDERVFKERYGFMTLRGDWHHQVTG